MSNTVYNILGRPLRRVDRGAASLSVLVAGLTHVPLIRAHLREAPYVGILFVALAVVATVLAVALLLHDSPLVWALVVGVMGLSLVAFFISRTVGLPQMPDDVGDWWGESMGLPAIAAEALGVGFGLAALLAGGRRRPSVVPAPVGH